MGFHTDTKSSGAFPRGSGKAAGERDEAGRKLCQAGSWQGKEALSLPLAVPEGSEGGAHGSRQAAAPVRQVSEGSHVAGHLRRSPTWAASPRSGTIDGPIDLMRLLSRPFLALLHASEASPHICHARLRIREGLLYLLTHGLRQGFEVFLALMAERSSFNLSAWLLLCRSSCPRVTCRLRL